MASKFFTPQEWANAVGGNTLGVPPLQTTPELKPGQYDPVSSALEQFQYYMKRQGTLKDTALMAAAAMPGLAGDAQELGNMLGIGPKQYGALFGQDFTRLQFPTSPELGASMGANPNTKMGTVGEFISPLPNELVTGGASILKFAAKSPDFQKLFRKATDLLKKDGRPIWLYHGAQADIERFSEDMMEVGADWGRGVYTSTNAADVADNYAGGGPDFENRLYGLKDRIEQAYFDDPTLMQEMADDLGYTADEVDAALQRWFSEEERSILDPKHPATIRRKADEYLENLARQELGVTNQGATVPLVAFMEKPAVSGGPDETFFDVDFNYDNLLDEYGEETGTLVELTDALRSLQGDFADYDAEGLIGDIYEEAMDYNGISLSRLKELVANSEHSTFAMDWDTGDMASMEVLNRALREMGYDGVIDYTAGTRHAGMDSITPDTVHVIHFDPDKLNTAFYGEWPELTSELAPDLTPRLIRIRDSGRYEVASHTFEESDWTRGREKYVFRLKGTEDWPKIHSSNLYDGTQYKRVQGTYNPEIAKIKKVHDKPGSPFDWHEELELKPGWHHHIPEKSQEGVLYRGISAEEWDQIQKHGLIESDGRMNIGDSQKGMTLFSTDIAQAENYASDFAPIEYMASPDKPAYVIAIRDPGSVPGVAGSQTTERGVLGPVSKDEIIGVWEGHPYRDNFVETEVIDDLGIRDGGGSMRGASVAWKELWTKPTTSGVGSDDDYLYHVTFSDNVPRLKKQGLRQFETSNWVRAGDMERYNQEGGVFAFTDPDDAFSWAFEQNWNWPDRPVSIVRMKRGENWTKDPAGDVQAQLAKGEWLRSMENRAPDEFIDEIKFDDLSNPRELGVTQDEWRQGIRDRLTAKPTTSGVDDQGRVVAKTVGTQDDFQVRQQRQLVEQMRAEVADRKKYGDPFKTAEKQLGVEERRLAKMEAALKPTTSGVTHEKFTPEGRLDIRDEAPGMREMDIVLSSDPMKVRREIRALENKQAKPGHYALSGAELKKLEILKEHLAKISKPTGR